MKHYVFFKWSAIHRIIAELLGFLVNMNILRIPFQKDGQNVLAKDAVEYHKFFLQILTGIKYLDLRDV